MECKSIAFYSKGKVIDGNSNFCFTECDVPVGFSVFFELLEEWIRWKKKMRILVL